MRARNALRAGGGGVERRTASEGGSLSLSLTHSVCWSWASAFCDAVNQYYGVHRGEWLCVCVAPPGPAPTPAANVGFPLHRNWVSTPGENAHSRFFPFSLSLCAQCKPFPYFFCQKNFSKQQTRISRFYFYCAPMSWATQRSPTFGCDHHRKRRVPGGAVGNPQYRRLAFLNFAI